MPKPVLAGQANGGYQISGKQWRLIHVLPKRRLASTVATRGRIRSDRSANEGRLRWDVRQLGSVFAAGRGGALVAAIVFDVRCEQVCLA